MDNRLRDRLRQSAVLWDCSDAELDRVLAAMTTRTVDAGATIVREGERGDEFFVIGAGGAEVRLEENGIVAKLGAGGCFGEQALIRDAPRAATVVATARTELFVLGRRAPAAFIVRLRRPAGRAPIGRAGRRSPHRRGRWSDRKRRWRDSPRRFAANGARRPANPWPHRDGRNQPCPSR